MAPGGLVRQFELYNDNFLSVRPKQMSELSKNFNFFFLSFQWLLKSSVILVSVTTNFLSMTTSIKKGTVPEFFLPYIYIYI